MQRARMGHDWATTSSVMAMIANVNRNPKKRSRPFFASDFNPMIPKKKEKGEPVRHITDLKKLVDPRRKAKRRDRKEPDGK